MSNFTHNLKVLLIDVNENIVENNKLLSTIKEMLQTTYSHLIIDKNTTIDWKLRILTKLQSHFMGDLFAKYPAIIYDTVIYDHIENSVKQIEQDLCISSQYKIRFHISRMPGY